MLCIICTSNNCINRERRYSALNTFFLSAWGRWIEEDSSDAHYFDLCTKFGSIRSWFSVNCDTMKNTWNANSIGNRLCQFGRVSAMQLLSRSSIYVFHFTSINTPKLSPSPSFKSAVLFLKFRYNWQNPDSLVLSFLKKKNSNG